MRKESPIMYKPTFEAVCLQIKRNMQAKSPKQTA